MSMKTVELLRRVLVYGLLIAGSIVFIMPLAWLLSTSLKGDTGLFQIPP